MTSPRLRAIFFGSPGFALPSLEALVAIADVAAVVCQPDRPAGRGLALTPPAVKVRAAELGLPVAQPAKVRTAEFARWAREQAADVALVVAYGRILPPDVLAASRLGCVNVHASLLPKYRGAAPVAWAVARGETETGVSLMKLDEGMDTGPVFARVAIPIGPDATAGEVSETLAKLGGDAVREWLPRYAAGACTLEPQDDAHATPAPILRKEDGRIDWAKSAREVHDHVRGMSPWPGGYTTVRGRGLKVHEARVVADGASGPPGRVVLADKARVVVACGRGALQIDVVQPEGRRTMRATEWLAGRGVAEGDSLGE